MPLFLATLAVRAQSKVIRFHFGTLAGEGLAGVAVKALWTILGLTPPLLAFSGMLVYWNFVEALETVPERGRFGQHGRQEETLAKLR